MVTPMRASWVIGLCVLAGCQGIPNFASDVDEVYRGRVLGAADSNCPGECSFIRRTFPESTIMEMTFDPEAASVVVGTISTTDELCGPSLQDVELVRIAPLSHDQLGLYEFPGDTRVRNYIYAAKPSSGPMMDRDLVVFVSLIRGERSKRVSWRARVKTTAVAVIARRGAKAIAIFSASLN